MNIWQDELEPARQYINRKMDALFKASIPVADQPECLVGGLLPPLKDHVLIDSGALTLDNAIVLIKRKELILPKTD